VGRQAKYLFFFFSEPISCPKRFRFAPHNDVSVNDGPHIRRLSHKIII
jgi:hypothetical protein